MYHQSYNQEFNKYTVYLQIRCNENPHKTISMYSVINRFQIVEAVFSIALVT